MQEQEVDNVKNLNQSNKQLPDYSGPAKKCDLDLILDIPLDIRVELGRTRMIINDMLQLCQGSVVELDRQVGDQVDMLIGDKLVARGEVVVMEDKFGIRLTDIISPDERIRSLG